MRTHSDLVPNLETFFLELDNGAPVTLHDVTCIVFYVENRTMSMSKDGSPINFTNRRDWKDDKHLFAADDSASRELLITMIGLAAGIGFRKRELTDERMRDHYVIFDRDDTIPDRNK